MPVLGPSRFSCGQAEPASGPSASAVAGRSAAAPTSSAVVSQRAGRRLPRLVALSLSLDPTPTDGASFVQTNGRGRGARYRAQGATAAAGGGRRAAANAGGRPAPGG